MKNNEKLYARGEEIDIEFRVLSRNDKELVKGFKCGNVWIDKFIKKQSYKDKETVTYVAKDDTTLLNGCIPLYFNLIN